MDELLGEVLQQRQIDLGFGQVDEIKTDLLAECLQGGLFGDKTQFDGRLIESAAFGLGLGVARQFQLPPVQEAPFQ